jgi:hypothetical protein
MLVVLLNSVSLDGKKRLVHAFRTPMANQMVPMQSSQCSSYTGMSILRCAKSSTTVSNTPERSQPRTLTDGIKLS